MSKILQRHREFTGPTPHSVAILARSKNKQPAEHLILERRKIEDLRNQSLAETKYQKLSKFKSAWEMSTDELIEKNCVMRKIEKHFHNEKQALEVRKEKLREMISAEEKQYYLEMDCTEEEYRSKQSLMKGRLQFLKEKRETERKQFVLEKMDQKFREECDDLRTLLSKQMHNKIFEDRNEQVFIKAEKLKKEAELEQYFAEMWQKDIKYKASREEIEAMQKVKINRSVVEVLNMQCQASENKREEEKKMKQHEKHLLEKEAFDQKEQENLWKKHMQAKCLATQKEQDLLLKLKKENEANVKQKDMALDMSIQNAFDEDLQKQMIQDQVKKRQQCNEMNCFMHYIEKTRHQKLQHDKLIEQHIIEEVEKQLTKKDERISKEKDARRMLMDGVLKTRQMQVQERKMLLKQKQEQKLVERHEIQKNIEEYKMLKNERINRVRNENRKYHNDLLQQIEYERQKKEKGILEARKEFKDMQNAEIQYQKKLLFVLNNADCSKSQVNTLPCIRSRSR